MKFLILVVFALSAANARPQSSVLDNYKELGNPSLGYKFGFQTTDPQQRQEEGSPKTVDGQDIISVMGKYNFETPDGTQYEVQYIADELGYRTKTAVVGRPGQGGSRGSGVDFGNGGPSFVGNGPAGVVNVIDSGVAASNVGDVYGNGGYGGGNGYNYGDNGYGSDGGVNAGYDANAYGGSGNGVLGKNGYEYNSPGNNGLVY